jgi:hypothetical protein
MDHNDHDKKEPGSSLSPIEVEGVSFDLEAASLHKGNGKKLIGLTLGCAAIIAVSVLALGDLDNRHAFVEAGTRMNGMHEMGYERFWNCALIGMNQAQIQSADELESHLHKRAQHYGRGYATLIKKCGTSLDALERDLDIMDVPKQIDPQRQAMQAAVGTTRQGLKELVDYVQTHGSKYDAEAGERYTSKLALSWQQYRVSHENFRQTLREHLQ